MDLKGSKTEKNILTAFAGESQARNRYSYFASAAKKEGYVQISDIFAGRGLTGSVSTRSNADGMDQIINCLARGEKGLLFANLVDFDMLFGHRLDAAGFAEALTGFDRWLPDLQAAMSGDDLLLLTADHGCDPTTPGTDHSREYVPILAWHKRLEGGRQLGMRRSFQDVAATIAEAFGLRWTTGASFFDSMM